MMIYDNLAQGPWKLAPPNPGKFFYPGDGVKLQSFGL